VWSGDFNVVVQGCCDEGHVKGLHGGYEVADEEFVGGGQHFVAYEASD